MNRQDLSVIALVVLALVATIVGLSGDKSLKYGILVAWLVFPPIYFFAEYLQAEKKLRSIAGAMDRFKDLQRLAGAIWSGVAAALGVIYFK